MQKEIPFTQIHIRLTPAIYNAYVKKAKENKVSLNRFINELLISQLESDYSFEPLVPEEVCDSVVTKQVNLPQGLYNGIKLIAKKNKVSVSQLITFNLKKNFTDGVNITDMELIAELKNLIRINHNHLNDINVLVKKFCFNRESFNQKDVDKILEMLTERKNYVCELLEILQQIVVENNIHFYYSLPEDVV